MDEEVTHAEELQQSLINKNESLIVYSNFFTCFFKEITFLYFIAIYISIQALKQVTLLFNMNPSNHVDWEKVLWEVNSEFGGVHLQLYGTEEPERLHSELL